MESRDDMYTIIHDRKLCPCRECMDLRTSANIKADEKNGAAIPYVPGPLEKHCVLLNLHAGDNLPDGVRHWNNIKKVWERVWNYSKAKEGIAYSIPEFLLETETVSMRLKPDPNNPKLSDTIPQGDLNRKLLGQQPPIPRSLIDDLMDYCAKWQKRLRLQDWKVYIWIVRMRDMEAPNRAAEVTIKWSEKVVYLRYLDPKDYVSCIADETELTIVHELCHVLTRGICTDEHCNPDAEEIAVICLSEALYKTEYPDWQETVTEYREVTQ